MGGFVSFVVAENLQYPFPVEEHVVLVDMYWVVGCFFHVGIVAYLAVALRSE